MNQFLRSKWLIFGGLIVLICAFSFYMGKNGFFLENLPLKVLQNSLDQKKFSEKEYEAFQKKLEAIVVGENPKVALEELRLAAKSGQVGKDCHNLTHNIGEAAYSKYKNLVKAFEYSEQVCGYGYTHGVLIAYADDVVDPIGGIEKTCQTYLSNREKSECFHAMGHILILYHTNDVSEAIKICSKVARTEELEIVCGQGVFMEVFSHEKNIDKEDLFSLCSQQEAKHKPECYKMAPFSYLILSKDNFEDILKWCEKAPKPYDYWCVRGVGLQLVQYSLKIEEIETFCLSGLFEQIAPCIEEVVRNKMLYHPKEVEIICNERLKDEYAKEICVQFMKARSEGKIK